MHHFEGVPYSCYPLFSLLHTLTRGSFFGLDTAASLHNDQSNSPFNNTGCSSRECLCKRLGFYSSSNFVDWLSGSAWLRLCGEAVVCKHSPEGT